MNKRGYIKIGKNLLFIILALSLLAMIFFSVEISAEKFNQYPSGSLTCEQFTDSVLWSAVGTKSASTTSLGSSHPGHEPGRSIS